MSTSLLVLQTENGYYLASNNGEKISSKKYDDINPFSRFNEFQVFTLNGKEGLLDNNGNEILPANYDYLSVKTRYLRGSRKSFIATNYGNPKNSHIIVVAKNEDTDLSYILLKNEITPRIQHYHELIQQILESSEFVWSEFDLVSAINDPINTPKLFKIDDFEKPVLYFYNEPVQKISFPASNSALYAIENNQIKELITGNESGGSSHGNFVQLYLEKEANRIVYGTFGVYGGFDGLASVHEIYYNKNECLSLDWMRASIGSHSYDDNFLLENAHLFYDLDGNPLSK